VRGLVLFPALTLGWLGSALAAQPTPQPFLASYDVKWKGFNAGTMEVELKPQSAGRFEYSSRANARGMFRAFFSEEITQTSWLELSESGVQPQRYLADDGSDSTERDISLEFDWKAGRVTGVAEEKPVDIPLQPGAQDAMSVQVAVMNELVRGGLPGNYPMVDKDKIKDYRYVREGEARVKTTLGEVETVVYRAERTGSKRATRMWFAPSMGYVAVQAERLKDGKREWLMSIRSLKR
jgi:hypothetical protein